MENGLHLTPSRRKYMKIKPLGDRVLVKPLETEEKKIGSIVIPDTAKEKPMEGEVIEVGTGKRNDKGELVPMEVKKNNRILYGKYSGTEVKIDGNDYLIMKESDILAIIE